MPSIAMAAAALALVLLTVVVLTVEHRRPGASSDEMGMRMDAPNDNFFLRLQRNEPVVPVNPLALTPTEAARQHAMEQYTKLQARAKEAEYKTVHERRMDGGVRGGRWGPAGGPPPSAPPPPRDGDFFAPTDLHHDPLSGGAEPGDGDGDGARDGARDGWRPRIPGESEFDLSNAGGDIVWPNAELNGTDPTVRTTLIPAVAGSQTPAGGVYIPLSTPPRPLPDDVRLELTARANLSRGFQGADVVVVRRNPKNPKHAGAPPPGVVAGNMLEYPKWHGLIEAVHTAFINELPLTIKPDHIMLAILQSIGRKVNERPELYRSELVHHTGKLLIEVNANGVADKILSSSFVKRTEGWEYVFPGFQQKMDRVLKLPTEMGVGFSSSTETDKLVRTIAVMDVVKAFVDFRVSITCGLSSVTLEGTKADWVALRDRVVPLLSRFGLSWKVELLQTLLSHFVAAFDGKTDGAFWENLYNHRTLKNKRRGCGPPPRLAHSKGWIYAFVTNQRKIITPAANWLTHDYVRPFETEHRLKEITGNGLNSVPFVLDNNGHKTEMTFAGGFAYGQLTPTKRLHPVTGAPEDVITPVVGWTVSNGIAE